ncbi:MAG: DUF3450 domain-containing protein [Pseudomonadales bacterium]|nr:DUF3450 domain-containing protein [Pseudomonadales bacterium]
MKAIFLMLAAALISTPTYATNMGDIQRKEQQKLNAAKTSQAKIDGVADQTDKIFDQFQKLSKDVEGLKIYNAQLKQQIDDQNTQLGELDNAIEQATVIERQIAPLTKRMIDTLEQFIALDLPFHQEERSERIRLLRDNFSRANITIAEKFRQVLEAYKIEREYGRKIDRYKQTITLEGKEMDVNVLRIGRIALLFETPNKQSFGYWNREAKQWQPLEEAFYRRSIDHGLQMASKQAAVDLLTVPVPAPQAVAAK